MTYNDITPSNYIKFINNIKKLVKNNSLYSVNDISSLAYFNSGYFICLETSVVAKSGKYFEIQWGGRK